MYNNKQKILVNRVPIFKWAPNYKWRYLINDFVAGLTVGLTAIPQGIAYATVAGLPPQNGLYSGFMGSFVYLFFGSCKDITIGMPRNYIIVDESAENYNDACQFVFIYRSNSDFVAVNTKIRCWEYSVFGVFGIYEWDFDIRVRLIEFGIFGPIYINAGELIMITHRIVRDLQFIKFHSIQHSISGFVGNCWFHNSGGINNR